MKRDPSASILERLLEPVSRSLNPASAKALVAMKADPVAAKRVSMLAEKCNEGALTTAEQREYETCVRVANFVAILKAKARSYLKRHAAS
jgi:hypothetical protein